MKTCPWCQSEVTEENSLLGVLGFLKHWRCRYCGGAFTSENKSTWTRLKRRKSA